MAWGAGMKPQQMWAVTNGKMVLTVGYTRQSAIAEYERNCKISWRYRPVFVKVLKVIVEEQG